MLNSDKPFSHIGHAAALLLICLAAAACGLTERIATSRTVEIDSVRHEVPRERHIFERPFLPADSLTFEDDRLKITIDRLPVPDDMSEPAAGAVSISDSAGPSDSVPLGADWWRLRAEVKPETVRVTLPQKTITEREETTKFVKQTPDLVKYLIGGLVAIIAVMAAAWRLQS